ncbi:MAG TPA: phenylalanine--tRNA ligase subunit beta [Vicinamibacterales bacterium]|nr:phenylalanine--tRNA ligase subunit beta [Vicinamibacterales bacterium]
MRVPLSWLREFVDVPGSADEIAATMSVRGFAVEGIEPLGELDAVIDFEVTANRPDCLSIVGIAREVATAYSLQVRRPAVRTAATREPARSDTRSASPADPAAPAAVEEPPAPDASLSAPGLHLVSLKTVEKADVDVVIENAELCPRYAGAVVDVKVGDSPAWLQSRLRAAGVRPISNIVDVTNYVLLELGQPMHAFDLARITGGQIRVRTARSGETIRTLDGQQRSLDPAMLVIADAERPVAVAGVMGGADSEVTRETGTIVLESACFNALSVRRTSKRLGLKTEASMRFERGADPRLPVTAMERACALLEHIGAGQARGTVVDRYPTRVEPRTLRLRRGRISGLLGVDVPDTAVRRILEGLGFALRDAADGWDVTVPTRRVDVVREVDLIEEVARHHGFDRIAPRFPALVAAAPLIDPRIVQARALRGVMTGAGFSEAVTFGFIPSASASPFAADDDVVPIENPLSESFAVLRPSILPGLIDAVAHNRRREQLDVRLFEIGARFSRSGGERRAIAMAWTGAAPAEHWSGASRQVDFFDMKGLVERVCEALALQATTASDARGWLVSGCGASLAVNDTRIGVLGQLLPGIAERHGLQGDDTVFLAEIDLDAADSVSNRSGFRVEPLPRYPSVTRDISIVVDASLPAGVLRRTIREAAPPALTRVYEFDRYQGKGIPEDKVSLSFRMVFRAPDRTLTDAEVQQAMESVMAALRSRHDAAQR